jgi:hypothetical protein
MRLEESWNGCTVLKNEMDEQSKALFAVKA